ncbi:MULTISPECIES: type II toxin-antitoxin system RelE/ParE family toxin [Thiorhodovibrio]|uniref:type II toxin-antitoxin system RelE/ParE family toxin n=1 Tax=Thiorhodovibrio TaxID=61593 RepID=UPI0019142D17|nr:MULTISPECIES: type II toxin-antitoxin system RelE/ParE family toxin [Thiorhodovibrio]WPL14421.1 Plasmid stabilization system protein [Thiorhodovibrio litoralis]
MPVIKRTAQAEEDLIDIWLYIANDNVRAADRILDDIEKTCSVLRDQPGMGK